MQPISPLFLFKELNSNFSKRKVANMPKNQINHGDPICTPRCNHSSQIFLFGELNRKFSKRKDLSICQKIKSIMAIRFAHPDATNLATFLNLKELNSNFSKRKGVVNMPKIKSIMAIRFAHPDATNLARFFYLES